ncbi:MAG: NTP transferase domain-containing protein [candidate division Zixibacteria bacterium]|nr:NTP transferase domain-containing protein [candidate division Zixibacteria bacterium]
MKAVIMAGGFGTRLRPLTLNIPKPMVPLGGIPVMEHLVKLLKKHNFTDIKSLLYFQADQIKNHFGNGSKWGVDMDYVMAQADFGTAGSVKNAQKYLDERFIIISGDVATDIDLTAAIKFHKKSKAQASMVLTRVENPLAYGVVIVDDNGRIDRFLEKPSWGQVFSDTINTGIYILEPEVLDLVPAQTEFDFSKDLFPKMLADKMRLYGFIADGYWRDIGNTSEYSASNQDLLEGSLNLGEFGQKVEKDGATLWLGEKTQVSPRATFAGTVIIGDRTKIGPRAKLFNSVIGADSIVGREADLKRCVAWDRVSIGPRVKASEAIICDGVVVSEAAELEENVIISSNAKVGNDALVKANVKVWPEKEVEAGAILSSSLVWGERWTKELFTNSKITGIANVEMTPELAGRLGAAYGAIVGENQTVIVSRDGSRSSRMLTRALIAGLISAGANVAELRTIPIPLLRYQLSLQIEAGGIYARVSPLSDRRMDIVFFDSGGYDIPVSKAKSIERLFLREDFRRASMEQTGKIEFPERVIEYYRDGFLQALNIESFRQSNLKVVIDFGFGGASEILPAILGALDIEVIALNAYPDPDRVYHYSQQEEKARKQLSAIVKSLKADAGFLIGPGAEKLTVVNEFGKVIDYQTLLCLILSLYLEMGNCRRVAVPVVASSGIEALAKKYKIIVDRIPDTHLAMMDALHKSGADFVGGTKGGFIFPGFQIGCDAMFAVAKILELMTLTGKHLGDVKQNWPDIKIINKEIPCSWTRKGLVMRRLMEHTARKKRILVDGVRFFSDATNITIKPDRYKASFYLQVESKSEDKAKSSLKEYASKIKQWQIKNRR